MSARLEPVAAIGSRPSRRMGIAYHSRWGQPNKVGRAHLTRLIRYSMTNGPSDAAESGVREAARFFGARIQALVHATY